MAYFGDLALILATVGVIGSVMFYFLTWRGKEHFLSLARYFFYAATVSIVVAISILIYSILTHDFSIAYVYSYSSTDLPLGFLISSLWGGQEGTFLLWIFFTSILGIVMLKTARQFENGNMFFLNLFLLSILTILLKKSPFELLPVIQSEGQGLNPLLQNYWMVIHPPIMFIGFSGVVFPFCFAMTALVERKFLSWSEAARRWTLFAWSALGISLVMGGYWAYETLGWGGFWAWDPVENSSLIPWLFLTAQVHSLFIKRQRRGLMRFSLIAVCMSFWSVLYGTFLTRSGVLADFSVHSFVDLGINQFLVSGLLFFVLLGVTLLLYRWREIQPEPSYSKVNSRLYMVTLGVLIIFLGGLLVLLGTSSPLLTSMLENPSNVGIQYYFSTMTPIAIALLILIGLFPAFRWNEGLSRKKLLMVGSSTGLVTIATLLVTGYTSDIIYLLLFGAAAAALVPNSYALISTIKAKQMKPGYLSHIGVAVAIAGAGTSAGFHETEVVTLHEKQTVATMGYNLTFANTVETAKGFDCHVELSNSSNTFLAVLPHEFPKNSEGVMKKPHVENYLDCDIYVSPNSYQPPEINDAGQMVLHKGESKKIDKYTFTFEDYDISNHGETEMKAAAIVQITYDDKSESCSPALLASGQKVEPISDNFDDGKGTVSIAGVLPEQGGVMLKIDGDFVPKTDLAGAILVIELSRKPLIILFWIGTILMFTGGLLSIRAQKRASKNPGSTFTAEKFDKEGVTV